MGWPCNNSLHIFNETSPKQSAFSLPFKKKLNDRNNENNKTIIINFFFFTKVEVIYALYLTVEFMNFTSQYNWIEQYGEIISNSIILNFKSFQYENTLQNILTKIYNATFLIFYGFENLHFGF